MIAGCATRAPQYTAPSTPAAGPPPTGQYLGPSEVIVTESGGFVVVPKGAEEVHRKLSQLAAVRGMGLEDRSPAGPGTVLLRYSGDPSEFVDCGRVVSTVNTQDGEKKFDFPASRAFMQYQIMSHGRIVQVERRMTLESIVTVRLKAVSTGRTRVDARAEYNLIRQQTASAAGYAKPLVLSDSIHFRSGGSALFPNAATRCESTGRLESSVLAAMR